MLLRSAITSLCLLCIAFSSAAADEERHNAADFEYFETKIRPLLAQRCFSCHSSEAKTVHGGLRLDTLEALKTGGDSGAAVEPGTPEKSLLISVLSYNDDIQMPPKGKLPQAEIDELTSWVRRGAPFPPTTDSPPRPDGKIDFDQGRRFWSFQPVKKQPLPNNSDTAWPKQRLDFFTLAAMEREGLTPSSEASRTTLVRRLYFDVIGLPPTPEQVETFAANEDPQAWEKLVNELLRSPQYGEKWARLWLDMARYTDRTASWLYKTGQSHLYRDWVVKALNEDMPYDEFVHRQLATDLMPETGPEDLPALGFLSLSPTYWKELKLPCEIIKVIVADEWEERVDAVSRTFLGLTVACARCHDHKFDPVSSEDYYALAGVFASCRQTERPLISEDLYAPVRKAKSEVEKLQAEIAKLKKQKEPPKEKLDELTAEISRIKSATPNYDTPLANALSEESLYVVRAGKTAQDGTKLDYRPEPKDLPVFIRGNPNRPGTVVPRRFLTVLSSDQKPFQNGSGRLELAQAITSEAAPLAARVIVNRIWLAHFGTGLVATPSNFGQQGERPTHPKLLNDLAARFIAGGWSIKKLHREILLSATWRQAVADSTAGSKSDPANTWLSRMNRRRLNFESWRDAMLSVSGQLDLTVGGPSAELDSKDNKRRTLYGTVHRRDMSTTLQIHDFPDPTQHSPKRSSTTTALQGLYALNGPLLSAQAQALAVRLQKEFPGDDSAAIRQAYRLLYSRAPTQKETRLGLQFLKEPSPVEAVSSWQQYAHVLLASNEFLFVD